MQSFWVFTKLSVPPILTLFFLYFVQLINIYFIGHLNDSALMAGVGLGSMLMNVLGFAVTQGLNGALESFVS